MKPVLVIGCSDAKLDTPAAAFDLYQGGIYKMLRKYFEDVNQFFDVLIVSAKHGFIRGQDVISPYDMRMCRHSKSDEIELFAKQHHANARELLRKYASVERELIVILSKDYHAAFNEIVKQAFGDQDKLLSLFHSHYISEGHLGIGDLRGRLGRVIKQVKNGYKMDQTYFRSGISNTPELGYIAAGNHGGTSLANVNTQKKPDLLAALLDSTYTSRLFIDNGLITCINKGLDVDDSWVFQEYRKIIDSLKPAQAKNVSIVVPDDPFDPDNALEIVKRNADSIKYLARKCDVILPIHRCSNIRNQARSLMALINNPTNIRLGIPCLSKKNTNFMLPVSDIDALLSLKGAKGNGSMFKKVHFFALSEVSSKKKLLPRLTLGKLHNVQMSFDCCRTTAVFGSNTSGPRAGTALQPIVKEEYLVKQISSHPGFVNHTADCEYYPPGGEPLISYKLYDLINEDSIHDFWLLYNDLLNADYALQVPAFSAGEEDEAIDMAWRMVGQKSVEIKLFNELKKRSVLDFKHVIKDLKTLSSGTVRFEAIKKLFSVENATTPMQLQLTLGI